MVLRKVGVREVDFSRLYRCSLAPSCEEAAQPEKKEERSTAADDGDAADGDDSLLPPRNLREDFGKLFVITA